MQVLLFEDVELLGWLGDVVTVKDGYARNYLLPQGLAGEATEANIKSLADEKARRAEQRQLERNEKEALAARINGAEVVDPLYTLTKSYPASVAKEVNVRVTYPAPVGCISF